MRQQSRLDIRQGDFDCIAVLGDNAGDTLAQSLAARGHLDPAFERGNDIPGIEFAAVMEFDAFADLDGVGFAVGADLGMSEASIGLTTHLSSNV